VEYSIGWPVDEQTVAAIEQLHERDWDAAVHADGALDPAAHVADLTGIMLWVPETRHPTRPADIRGWPRRVGHVE